MKKIRNNKKLTKKKEVQKLNILENLKDMNFNLKKYFKLMNEVLVDELSFGKSFFGTLTKLEHFVHNGDSQYIDMDCIEKDFINLSEILIKREFESQEKEKDFYEIQQELKYDESEEHIEAEIDKYSARPLLKAMEIIVKGFAKEQRENMVGKIIEKCNESSMSIDFKKSNGGITPILREEFYSKMVSVLKENYNINSNSVILAPSTFILQFRAIIGENTDKLIVNKYQLGDKQFEQIFLLIDDYKVELIPFKLEKRAFILIQKDELKIDINKQAYLNFKNENLENSDLEFKTLENIQSTKIITRDADITVSGNGHVVSYAITYGNKDSAVKISVKK